MVKIHAMVVTKNEAGRYLEQMLRWTKTFTDGIYVYDDQSTDSTADVALACGAEVGVRPDATPSFLEDEGSFREAAWRWMEGVAAPTEGDWVFVLDADEFFVSDRGERYSILEDVGSLVDVGDGLYFDIPEIFAVAEGSLYQRVDGYWGTITGHRLIKYRPDSFFPKKGFAVPPVPDSYLVDGHEYQANSWWKSSSHILHLGYAHPDDVKAKFERYRALPGHNPKHVNSIPQPGRLEIWEGRVPEWL